MQYPSMCKQRRKPEHQHVNTRASQDTKTQFFLCEQGKLAVIEKAKSQGTLSYIEFLWYESLTREERLKDVQCHTGILPFTVASFNFESNNSELEKAWGATGEDVLSSFRAQHPINETFVVGVYIGHFSHVFQFRPDSAPQIIS